MKTLEGNCFSLEVDSNTTIEDLKMKIQDKYGIPPEEQRLMYGGNELENDRKLADYCIRAESTFNLVLRMHIFVKTPTGRTITLEVEPNETLEIVKIKIQEKMAINPEYQCLVFSGNRLVDNLTLNDYKVKNNDILRLV